jgi:hypothetical protein
MRAKVLAFGGCSLLGFSRTATTLALQHVPRCCGQQQQCVSVNLDSVAAQGGKFNAWQA